MGDFSLCLPEISRQELSLLLDGAARNYRFLFYVDMFVLIYNTLTITLEAPFCSIEICTYVRKIRFVIDNIIFDGTVSCN